MKLGRYSYLTLPIISILAGVFALVLAHQRTGRLDGYAFASLDSHEYHQLAQNIAQHGCFSQSEKAPYKPDTWRTPGYPLFLAIHLLPPGHSAVELIVFQQLLNLVSTVLLASIARKYMSDRRALIVGLLFVIEPYHHLYSLWLMPTTLFVTVLLATWYFWHKAIQSQRLVWFAIVGVLAGCVVLVRPVGILVPPAILLGLVWLYLKEKRTWRNTLRVTGAALLGSAVVVCPWMLRNQMVAGHFALSHESGAVLAYFKAGEVMLWRLGRTAHRYEETSADPKDADLPHGVWDDIDARLRNRFSHLPADQLNQLQWPNLALGNKTQLDSFELSAALSSIGWELLAAEPLSTVTCCVVRCAAILTFPLNFVFTPAVGSDSPGSLKGLLLGGAYLGMLGWVVVKLLRGQVTLRQAYFPLACVVALLVVSTPQLDPRFRVPMIPFLIFVALLPNPKSPTT